MSGALEPAFFSVENIFGSLFANTILGGHFEIQKLIFEYAFDLETCLNISLINKDGSVFFKKFKKFTLDKIRSLGTLEYQDWMNSDPNSWLAWLLMENEDGSRKMIPLDPKITMRIFFNSFRKLHPISYKRRIRQENVNDGYSEDPYVSVELSGISLGNSNLDVESHSDSNVGAFSKNKESSFLTIYEMFGSNEHVFALDVVYGRPYDAACTGFERGGGEVVVHVHPRHIFEVLSHRNFADCLYKDIFYGIKENYRLGDWSGYLDKEASRLMNKQTLPKEIIDKYEKYTSNFNCKKRNNYPFINMLLTSFFCHKRGVKDKIDCSLYNASVDIMENLLNNLRVDEIALFSRSVSLNSPNIIFFENSSVSIENNHYKLFFNYLTSTRREQYVSRLSDPHVKSAKDKGFEFEECYADGHYTDGELLLNWSNIDGKSPLFGSSYKDKYKPPWRTSIDCVKNAMREKQLRAVQRRHELQCFQLQQPSISAGNERLRSDGGCLRRIRGDSLDDCNDGADSWEDNLEREAYGADDNVGNNGSLTKEFDSPSLVASGFVMGVRCLPASTAVTSLGSIIGEGTYFSSMDNNARSFSNPNTATRNIRQNSQRLSVPLSDITGRISSCHTLSSIATSWGTPVPITRTIPMDDILGRQQNEFSQNKEALNDVSSDSEDKNNFTIRLRLNESSGDEESDHGDRVIESSSDHETENADGEANNRNSHLLKGTVIDGMSSLQISNTDASLLAKETLKSWKYVNYDFDEEEDGYNEC
ncbi:hypothetical protein FG386_000363 [Cryptosporidium ryanae]|uniref:uncharacterized protein n=1 Tax=Cryptosporidium ryanae TaxID=515981 RepID=UPI00351A4F67|nr:hypothetical protein FG386_000363 [Cryptosporidium ryanae]